jgi:hypothetical protein
VKSKLTSIRSQGMPAGGTTATQPVTPNVTPASVAELVDYLTPAISRFRAASSPLTVPLDSMVFAGLGDQKQTRIASVGLGERVIAIHNVVINLANSAGAAQTVTVSNQFPYNLLQNTQVQINGGETTYSASGRAGLAVWGRDRGSFFAPAPALAGLNRALLPTITFRANLTPTATTPGNIVPWLGTTTIQVALSANGNLTLQFVTVEKLAHSRDTMLGALPLQNNSTYATLTRQVIGALTTTTANAQIPFFSAGANITATLTSYSVKQFYRFWGIPSDPSLYQPLIENSYQVIEAKGLTAAATGTTAITYNVPQNLYLAAAHIWANDGNGADLNPVTAFTRTLVQYNAGSVVPVVQDPNEMRAMQYADYGADYGAMTGYRLWDGADTTEALTITDDAGWVDTYAAAEPQLAIDVLAGTVTPISYNVTREAIVAGAVQQLGG